MPPSIHVQLMPGMFVPPRHQHCDEQGPPPLAPPSGPHHFFLRPKKNRDTYKSRTHVTTAHLPIPRACEYYRAPKIFCAHINTTRIIQRRHCDERGPLPPAPPSGIPRGGPKPAGPTTFLCPKKNRDTYKYRAHVNTVRLQIPHACEYCAPKILRAYKYRAHINTVRI